MKKTLLLIVCLGFLAIISFFILTNANSLKLDEETALEIGEEKYLTFLWMVDGAFNSEKMGEDFTVNNKKLADKDRPFICDYSNKKNKTCVISNFEEIFKKLFISNITYNEVYGNNSLTDSFKHDKDNYIFSNADNCSFNRMNLNQNLKLVESSNSELVFNVYDVLSNNLQLVKPFVLAKEDGIWKIKKAYYHNACEIRFNIG